MKHHTRSLSYGIAFCCLVLIFPASTLVAGTISIQPPALPVTGATPFTLAIHVSDVADLYAYQFDLGFDPSILRATNIVEGPFLASGGATFFIPGTIDNTAGAITFTADSLLTALSGVTGSGVLATVHFEALRNGTSAVSLFNLLALDSSLLGTGQAIQSASVAVSGIDTAVPEPSTLISLLTALLVAAGVGRLRRARF